MNESKLKSEALQNASTEISRAIVQLSSIGESISDVEPLRAILLYEQVARLKTVLKEIEKARILEAKLPRQSSLTPQPNNPYCTKND